MIDATDDTNFDLAQCVSGATVRLATTANVNLATGGLLTIDTVVTSLGDRVLVKNQTIPSQNGLYVVNSGAWTRTPDFNNLPEEELLGGLFVYVTEGGVNATSMCQC